MAKGGTLTQRANGKWQAKIRLDCAPAISKTFIKKIDAERFLNQTLVDIDRRVFVDHSKSDSVKFRDLFERYEKNEMLELRGKHVRPALNQLKKEFSDFTLTSLKPEHISAFRDSRARDGKAASTVKKEINLLSKIIDLAKKDWGFQLAQNPCDSIKKPIEQNARDRRLQNDEENRLLTSCAVSSEQLCVIATLAIETCARLSELLSLRWIDVDFEKRTAKIVTSKNGESRSIPLSSRAVAVLRELTEKKSARIFTNWTAADSFSKTFARACKSAQIEGLHFHDLRHEAISRLASRFQQHELMKISGHKTPAMLSRYYHPRAEDFALRLD